MSELAAYKKMYFELFQAVTVTVSTLDLARIKQRSKTGLQKEQMLEEKIEFAILNLRKAQQNAEQTYMQMCPDDSMATS